MRLIESFRAIVWLALLRLVRWVSRSILC